MIKRIILIILITLWILVFTLLIWLAYVFKKNKKRDVLAQIAFQGLLLLLGIRVTVIGKLSSRRPLLLVSNHVSYLDILVIGGALNCRFVPKQEIESWFFISFICRILDAVFVNRNIGKVRQAKHDLGNALTSENPVILFPEGTTGDGRKLLPFRSSLFSVAKLGTVVQPVAISYKTIGGLPIEYGKWPLIAWYGDMELVPHLWNLLSLGKIDVELHLLPPLDIAGQDRKELARKAHDAIENVLRS